MIPYRRRIPRVRFVLGALAGGIALTAADAHAYRTGQDSPALEGQGRVAWEEGEVGFYLVEEGLPPGVTREIAQQAIEASLASWEGVECSELRPFFAGWADASPAPMDGRNTIAWVSDWERRGYPSTAPGNTDMQYRRRGGAWQIGEADVYLNAQDYAFSFGEGPGLEVEAVMTHELGHALGLLHPCEPNGVDGAPDCERVSTDVAETTMFPLYTAGQSTLAPDDEAGLCYLYPGEGGCLPDCPRGEECVEGECRASCVSGLCEVGQICGFWGCIAPGSCAERSCLGATCEKDDACGPLSRCVDGLCTAGAAAWGDGCQVSPDCAEGACVGGVCQPDCVQDAECGSFGKCVESDEGTARGCVSSGRYETGQRCVEGEDCESGICIFTAKPSVCTDTCTDAGQCPTDWSCATVDNQQVCVPPNYRAAGGGCAVSWPSAERSTSTIWLGLLSIGAWGMLRRGSRRSRVKRSARN